ncbi:ABC transporter substrate-binding protein [Caproiciproducens sp. R2]|uniref:ABC transporter substrate-binding protein n=1 Tax=Caproiciproducens sp. R2 TaxID=3435187 RepID=UPI004033F43C
MKKVETMSAHGATTIGKSWFRKITALVMALCLTFSYGCAGNSQSSDASGSPSTANSAAEQKFDGKITIGVSAGITGSIPMAGERTLQGVKMAVEEINAKGGVLGKELVIEVADDQSNQSVVINAVNKLASNPDVVAIIGPHLSGSVMAASDTLKKAKVPFLSQGTSPKLRTIGNEYLFKIRPCDAISAEVAAKYAVEDLGAKKVGISYNNNDFGVGGKGVIEAYLTKVGVPFVSEGHNSGDKDLTGQIMKLKNENVDVVISWTDDAESALTARQFYELNLNKPVITSTATSTQQVLDLIDEKAVEGFYSVCDFVITDPSEEVQDFAKRFKEKYGIAPDQYAGNNYSVTYLIADAITRAGKADREAIREALASTKDVSGLSGTYHADSNNELIHECKLVQIKSKVPQVIKTISVDVK